MAGCENWPTRLCDVFDDWEAGRKHLLSVFIGYYNEIASGDEDHPQLSRAITEVQTWTSNVYRSVVVGSDSRRFFLYPVVAEEEGHKLACPRCLLDVQATQVVHGLVEGGDKAPVAFEPTMPVAYRVYCEGDCEAESDEAEDLFDAIDGFMRSVTWPRHVLGPFGMMELPPIGWHEDEGRWRTSPIVPVGSHDNEDDPGYFVLELVENDNGTVGYRVDFHPDSTGVPFEAMASGSLSSTSEAKREAERALRRLLREASS
jgi:hypothetical protein